MKVLSAGVIHFAGAVFILSFDMPPIVYYFAGAVAFAFIHHHIWG